MKNKFKIKKHLHQNKSKFQTRELQRRKLHLRDKAVWLIKERRTNPMIRMMGTIKQSKE